MRVKTWSLRHKLVAVLIAAVLVPYVIASIVDLRLARAELRAGIAQRLAINADQLRGRIAAFHQGNLMSVGKLADVPAIAQLLHGTADPSTIALVHRVMEVQVDSDYELSGMAIIDPDGQVVASLPALDGTRLPARSYSRGEPWVSDPFLDPVLSNPSAPGRDVTPTLAYTAPVTAPPDPHGFRAVQGYVVLWIDATALVDLARGANDAVDPGSFAMVLDRDGIRIAHSTVPALMYRPVAALAPARQAAALAQQRFGPGTAADLVPVAFPALVDHLAATTLEPAMFRGVAPSNGADNYVVVRHLDKLAWTVACLVPASVIDHQLAVLTAHKLIIAGSIMIAAFALALWLASLLLRPIDLLAAATRRITAGDLSARVRRVAREPTDELGQLCASFDAMAARLEHDAAALRRSRDELEDRVADRTGELVRAAVTEAQARAELEVSARRLEVLSRTAHELAAASGDADLVLELAARRLGETVGDACTVRLVDDDGAHLAPTRALHYPDPTHQARLRQGLAATRVPLGAGIAGRVAQTGAPVRIPEVSAEALATEVPPALLEVLGEAGVTSLLAVPLRSRDRTTGVVTLLRLAGGGAAYTVDDQRFAQDVADRAGLALDNAMLVATLERRVAARTAALEAANHELEAFSYSVSHDLRAPLRTIDGFSEILASDYTAQLPDDAHHYLQRIRAATQRMASLIDDLLNLARITRVQLRWHPIDVSAIARQVAAELARRDPARATAVHIAPGLCAHGDARLITIALENLVGNAWKFTARHPAAEIWLGAEPDGAGRAVFHVRDTGAGFDMKYADKLFLPFQRLHAADEFEGVGVGLATVHRIISHHGGRIWAEATVGAGAAFFFYLGDPR